MTASPHDTTRYHLLTPVDWWRIPLRDTSVRSRAVRALVRRQLPGRDSHVLLRRDLTDQLGDQAAGAAAAGGLEMFLCVQLAGAPIASTLTTYLVPTRVDDGAVGVRTIVGDGGGTVDNVDLPLAGPAVRRHHRRDAHGTPAEGVEEAPTSVLVDYWVPVPDEFLTLQLTFSTPLVQVEEAMVELFDAVAGSLRWTGEGTR